MRVRREVRCCVKGLSREARFRAWAMTKEGRANTSRLMAMRGKYKGRRCFVMGNGPSLLECDLNQLGSEITIVSNAHYLIWDQLEYTPTLLAVEDRLVAEDRTKDLKMLSGVTKVFPYDLRPLLGPSSDSTLFSISFAVTETFPSSLGTSGGALTGVAPSAS